MFDDDYRIEEMDDERTLTGELVPDCERDLSALEEEKLMEYYELFHQLLDDCRSFESSWKYDRMLSGKDRRVVICASKEAKKYAHEQCEKLRAKVKDDLKKLKEFNYQNDKIPCSDRDFLNGIIMNHVRRSSYYETIRYGKKTKKYFSFQEFEERYKAKVDLIKQD